MVNANVMRVEKSCERMWIALEALIAILEDSDRNAALYEHMKTTCHDACDENRLAVRALVEQAKTSPL